MKTLVERLYARLTPRAVYLPFENMPQDKMILLAAREAHVAAIGEQHTTVPAMQLNFFLGRGESLRAPLPGMLRCAGVVSMEKLAAGGWARERLTLGGSRRFPKPPQELPPAASPKDVLVVLPIDAAMTQDLLAALRASYPQGPRDFRFVIQPHPAEPLAAEQLPPGAELSASGFRDNLGRCGRVLSCGTLAGLEALLAGRQLLRYRCDAQLDLDPLEDLPDSVLPTAGAWNLADKLEKLDENDAALRSQARALWDGLFAAPQEAAR
jgi:surface carbohydrate biosynthesis protein (TIGR04326 family)